MTGLPHIAASKPVDLRQELEVWLAEAKRGQGRSRQLHKVPESIHLDPAVIASCKRNKVILASGATHFEQHCEVVPTAYRDTATVCSSHLERDVARAALLQTELGKWLLEVARVNCYRSPGGVGTPLHFDAKHAMVMQTVGTKRWWVADAPGHPFPTRNCVPLPGASTVFHDRKLVPIPNPASLRSLFMTPGDVLLLPAGTWHCTEAETASTSFTIAFMRTGGLSPANPS